MRIPGWPTSAESMLVAKLNSWNMLLLVGALVLPGPAPTRYVMRIPSTMVIESAVPRKENRPKLPAWVPGIVNRSAFGVRSVGSASISSRV